MITAMRFLMFYMFFFLFVGYISVLAGATIFTDADLTVLVPSSAVDLINPLFFVNAMWVLFNISSDYALLYTVMVVPFLVGVVYIVAAWVRGVSPT